MSDIEGRRRFLGRTIRASVALAALPACGTRDDDGPSTPSRPTPSAAPPPSAPLQAAPREPGADLPGKDLESLILHGSTPPTLETRRDLLTGVITPTSRLFVRQNVPLPPRESVLDRDAWSVAFEGVAAPRTLPLADLRRMGMTTIATVLQCSGNGRRFFEHHPSGTQWTVGAAGCVLWTGVPVRAVVERLGGVSPGARFLTATGAEPIAPGVRREDVVVERSIPVDKALDDCLLAWELNGEPLAYVHGAPLRLIVPGYYGVNQVKFVGRIAFTEQESTAKIQVSGYRMRDIGQAGSPDQPSMMAMGPKSFITSPTASTPQPAGQVRVTGVAFGGVEPVRKVEVSTDGARWTEAEFVGPDLGKYAWRVFQASVEATTGALALFSRVTTASGRVQPERRLENDHGYGNDSWRDMGVVVAICAAQDSACLAPPEQAASRRGRTGPVRLSASGERGRQIFRSRAAPSCTTCHSLAHAEATGHVGPDLDDLGPTYEQVRTAVMHGVGTMPAFTQSLTPAEIDDVAAYVFEATHGVP